MSLINQMLADLEARRGGRLDSSARALEGLQPVYLALPARADGPLRLLVAAAAGAGVVALAWYGLQGSVVVNALLGSSTSPPPSEVMPVPPVAPAASGTVTPVTDLAGHGAAEAHGGAGERPDTVASIAAPDLSSGRVDTVVAGSVLEPEPLMTPPATVPVVDRPAGEAARAAAPADPAVEYRGTVRLDRHVDRADPAVALAGILPRLQGPGQTRALRDLERLVAGAPAYLPARQALASELLRSRQTAAAERVLRAGLVATPNAPRLAELLAHVLVARGDAAGALAALHKARPAATGDGEYAAFVAALEQRVGRHADAVLSFRAALATAPGRGAWWTGLAISLAAQGLADEARAAYDRALADRQLSANLRRYAERARARLPVAG